MEAPIIKVEDVSKVFKLPHEKTSSVKSAFINFYRRNKSYEMQQALKGVSFEVKQGEFFGIVGRNGSGKSTMLKLLAGIYMPTEGHITVNGRLTPFIELGVGFNAELTGRENVFLNGALLGFNRKEMKNLYKEIVEFSELKPFMDQKLKNYSSGMQVRLAFSIAIQAKSDILLLDEVLAVGDEAFQKKCLSVFEKYKAKKQTVVLVTHDMSIVEKYCDSAILIDKGEVINAGEPRKIAHQYSRMNTDSYIDYKKSRRLTRQKEQRSDKWGLKMGVFNDAGKRVDAFKHGETATIRLSWGTSKIKNVGIALLKQSGEYVFGVNTVRDKHKLKGKSLEYKIKLNLGEGDYEFKLGLFGEKENDVLEFLDGPQIFVENSKSGPAWEGLTNLEHKWG